MKHKKTAIILSSLALILLLIVSANYIIKKTNLNRNREVAEVIDSFNGVNVYFNGGVDHVLGRNLTKDGYNLGLKYQCVEFVKRYYYEHLNHKMPDSYGHAKHFINPKLKDGVLNPARNLRQFNNPSTQKPQVNDIVIFKGTLLNPFGHVAIISEVTDNDIEIIQQNPGPFSPSRERYPLIQENHQWIIQHKNIIGRLGI